MLYYEGNQGRASESVPSKRNLDLPVREVHPPALGILSHQRPQTLSTKEFGMMVEGGDFSAIIGLPAYQLSVRL